MYLIHGKDSRLTTFLRIKVTLPCFKELPLNSTLAFELCIHFGFGERPLVSVTTGLVFSFDNPLYSDFTIVSVIPAVMVKRLKIGWNIKTFCDPSSLN